MLKNEGLDVVFYKLKIRRTNRHIYKRWIAGNERNILETASLQYNPRFSVVIPVYNVADDMLRACIDSVLNQTYHNFEIILVDDASTQESVRTVLAQYDPRMDSEKKVDNPHQISITVIYRQENGHISRCTNDGIAAATGEFVALCDCDDLYAPNALYEVAKKLNEDRTLDFIYSDEDKISEDGKVRKDPFFKPDWSPETFMSYMYTCHLAVYRRSLLNELGGLRVGFEGSQDYDLVLRVMEKTTRIGHVPKILYHWRMRKESTANALTAKPYILESTRKAKEEALERRGLLGKLSLIPDIGQYRVTYIPKDNPLVSIIIPSKDNVPVLKMGLTSIVGQTDYSNYEIVLVDNGSSAENKEQIEKLLLELNETHPLNGTNRIRYIYEPMTFNFSKMCNLGAANAKGEFLLFLNDDIEVSKDVEKNDNTMVVASQWLSILTGQAQVPYTGAVGAKLYYPNSICLQHAGVLNLAIGPGHCLYGREDNLNYYYGRNLLDYNFSVVTGACLMVDRKKFDEIGGFDEDLPIAYNDVDLCFRLVKKGYYNVLRNDVALVHHESVSRGLDEQSVEKEERRKKEMAKLYEKNPEFANGYDPCYNPNLVSDRGDFSFNMSKAYEPKKPKKQHDKDFPGHVLVTDTMDLFAYHIDNVNSAEGVVRIDGWIYQKKKANNNHNKVKVLLKGTQGLTYLLDSEKMYRSDVARPDGKRRGLSLCGFETVFLQEKVKPGKYRIGLVIGKLYCLSDRYLEM